MKDEERFSFEKSDRELELRTQALNWAIFGILVIATLISGAFLVLNLLTDAKPLNAEQHDPRQAFFYYGLPQGVLLGLPVFFGVFKQPALRMLSASGQRGWMILCGVLFVLAIIGREVIGENNVGRMILQQLTLAVPCGYWAHWQMLRMEDPKLSVLPQFSMSTLLVLMFSMAAAGAAFVKR